MSLVCVPYLTLFSPPPQASVNKDVLWELLFSLPTTPLTSIITWSINTLLILFAADFVFTPVIDSAADVIFTRVGAVYPDAAKIVVRYPISDANSTENNVLVLWRSATAAAVEPWTDGPIVHLQYESDWTNTTRLTKLWPSTEYECAYTFNCCSPGAYTRCPDVLAHTNRTVLPYPASPIRFRTFPDSRLPTGSHFRFVVSSCLKPNFPYAPFQNRRIKGFELLADYLFAEPTIVDTPGFVSYAKASDNATVGRETNGTNGLAPTEVPPILEGKRVVPTEFMLFLVRGCFVLHHDCALTRHRVTLSMPTSRSTTAIRNTPTVDCTGATTTVLVSARSLSNFVRP